MRVDRCLVSRTDSKSGVVLYFGKESRYTQQILTKFHARVPSRNATLVSMAHADDLYPKRLPTSLKLERGRETNEVAS